MINTNMLQAVAQLRQNPMQVLGRMGVPANLSNDPRGIIQHLMNNGRITQNQYDQAMQMASSMGINLK